MNFESDYYLEILFWLSYLQPLALLAFVVCAFYLYRLKFFAESLLMGVSAGIALVSYSMALTMHEELVEIFDELGELSGYAPTTDFWIELDYGVFSVCLLLISISALKTVAKVFSKTQSQPEHDGFGVTAPARFQETQRQESVPGQ